MTDTVKVELLDADQWRHWARTFKDYNYRQLWDYGIASAGRRGAVSEHVRVCCGSSPLGAADVRVKKLRGTGTGIAYINGGPLVRQSDSDWPQQLALVLKGLAAEYGERRKLLVRIQPATGTAAWNQDLEPCFRSAGFKKNPGLKSYRTLLLDLGQGEELLMQGLAKKWRYNLRKAMTEEYVVQSGTSEELFDRFCAMYEPFRQEKGFEVDLGPSFYAPIQRALPEEERMIVSLAEQNGQLLAGHVFSLLGDTGVNLFRAMTSEGAKTHVSYLLQWNAIVKAVNHRCRFYDMGGIDPDGNPGVYSFKKGVGGEDLTMAGPYEYQPDFLHTMLVRAAEKAYLKWMALKSG